MSDKRPNSKHKIDRRLNCNLWGRPGSPFNSRQTGPGMHGARRPKPTDYGVQLMAKQKLKGYYANIGERKFRRYYQEAVRLKGDTGENLVGLLERRLDAVCYRAKFVPTIFAARQLVSHGHVTVNGKRVTIGSFSVKPGDKIELTDKARQMALCIAAADLAERDVPDYIEIDAKAGKAVFLRQPKLQDVPYPVQMEPHLVVEFYSR